MWLSAGFGPVCKQFKICRNWGCVFAKAACIHGTPIASFLLFQPSGEEQGAAIFGGSVCVCVCLGHVTDYERCQGNAAAVLVWGSRARGASQGVWAYKSAPVFQFEPCLAQSAGLAKQRATVLWRLVGRQKARCLHLVQANKRT